MLIKVALYIIAITPIVQLAASSLALKADHTRQSNKKRI